MDVLTRMEINLIFYKEELPDSKVKFFIICAILIEFIILSRVALGEIFNFSQDAQSNSFILSLLFTAYLNFFLIASILFRFKKYFFSILKKPVEHFFKGFLFYFLIIPFLILISLSSHSFLKSVGISPKLQDVVLLSLQLDSNISLILFFIVSVFIAPIAEEIIYRGVVYKALKRKFSVTQSIFISSAVFASLHFEFSYFPALFFLGMVLAFLFEKYNNLWVSIGVHFFNNFFASLVLLVLRFTNIVDINQLNI